MYRSMHAGLPGVLSVAPSRPVRATTTRSWDFLGLSLKNPSSKLLYKARLGEGIIVGVVDSGDNNPLYRLILMLRDLTWPCCDVLISVCTMVTVHRRLARVEKFPGRRFRPRTVAMEGQVPDRPALQRHPLQPEADRSTVVLEEHLGKEAQRGVPVTARRQQPRHAHGVYHRGQPSAGCQLPRAGGRTGQRRRSPREVSGVQGAMGRRAGRSRR